jgi:hypothetical protein
MEKTLKLSTTGRYGIYLNVAKAQAAACILASCCVSIGLILLAIA